MNITKSDDDNIAYLDQVFSVLRHELGNAVHAMTITLEVLKENYDRWNDEKRMAYLLKLSSLIARPERLVDAMMMYSGVEAGKIETIDAGHLVEMVVSKISARLRKDPILFTFHIEKASGRIHGNPAAVEKVVMNIIENAIDALSGQKKPEINLMADTGNGRLKIRIKDNGDGIEPKDLPKVFIPIFSTKPGHMGMGLPVARRLLVQMNGGIEIQSRKDSGTRVDIWLDTS